MDLAYDGAGFHGWARQDGLRTVQGELEAALATVLRVPSLSVTCAGRTDTGVHARGQVAHVDVEAAEPDRLRRQLDGLLPDDISVRRVAMAADGFDARFSALWRRYAYRIADHPETVDPLTRGHVLAWRRPLDLGLIEQAATLLLGRHDFAAFCKRREGATTIRTLLSLTWEREPGGLLVGSVVADAFCHHMVRSLVGCLVAVGEGRRPPEWAGEVLAGQTRDPSVTVVPAHGLTLEEVGYPPDDELAGQALAARRVRTLEDEA
ncbi:tRNA pseudouridine(38-40) synthase TruA [Nocardioides agariphilus]|jgi:tRNA pseudouridine38-40 synthase|uniref:tRNA pseudouridine synthase A n=2 Tax=Nocardioides agariphilus TaxID=433664 RepID=A0A930VK85_9ACTN|nr:tRNA pseudouridine(38-40) synthase TruA [Nocardioides agariphilus]MBF4769089.1 tRNA pseudouridine(38-40) synthase TruA [Nocardioides agariphilus]